MTAHDVFALVIVNSIIILCLLTGWRFKTIHFPIIGTINTDVDKLSTLRQLVAGNAFVSLLFIILKS